MLNNGHANATQALLQTPLTSSSERKSTRFKLRSCHAFLTLVSEYHECRDYNIVQELNPTFTNIMPSRESRWNRINNGLSLAFLSQRVCPPTSIFHGACRCLKALLEFQFLGDGRIGFYFPDFLLRSSNNVALGETNGCVDRRKLLTASVLARHRVASRN